MNGKAENGNLSWSVNGLEIFKVLNRLMSQYRKKIGVFFQNTFTSFRNDPFLQIDFFEAAKICWNLLIFSKHLFCKNMHPWAHFRNTINQLHVNGTWSILAVISFIMAVISWTANDNDDYIQIIYLYRIERNNTSQWSTQTRICYIEASRLSVVRSRETVPKEQDKKKVRHHTCKSESVRT